MNFIQFTLAGLLILVTTLLVSFVVYKREKKLLALVEKYKYFYFRQMDDWYELKKAPVRSNNEAIAYRKAIDDCIENFNATYSNTRLSFDEAKCAFVIEDIDVDDSLPTEEEITPQNENNNENQQSI